MTNRVWVGVKSVTEKKRKKKRKKKRERRRGAPRKEESNFVIARPAKLTIANSWKFSRVNGTLISPIERESSLLAGSKKLPRPTITRQFKFNGKIDLADEEEGARRMAGAAAREKY